MRIFPVAYRACSIVALASSCAGPVGFGQPTGPARAARTSPSPASAPLATPAPSSPSSPATAAAIVWTRAQGLPTGFHSVWIEPSAAGAVKLAERDETVVVGSQDLWVVRERKIRSENCEECDLCNENPPRCKKNSEVTLTEPYLVSLRNGRALRPFEQAFQPADGCASGIGEHDAGAAIEGAVGTVVFGSASTYDYFCGAAHGSYGSSPVTFSADSGAQIELSFPASVEPLRQEAHEELVAQGCVMDANQRPAGYRATAEYDATGTLQGRYSFTMDAPYVCGTGPGHYSVETTQSSSEIPPELTAWRRLPAWVAGFMSATNAQYGFVLPPERIPAARAEFARH